MPDPTRTNPKITLKIGGQKAASELMADLREIVVNSDLHQPAMFTLEFNDPELKWVDAPQLELGKEVEISAQAAEQGGRAGASGALIKGEITALEPDFDEGHRARLVVRGYDKSHRLHRGRKTRSFLKQTDDKIAQTVAGECGLPVETDATTIEHEYVLQNNQTNMEFLRARAERIGYRAYVAEGKLYFKKGDAKGKAGPELKWGEALRWFRPRASGAHQADKVSVRGWDVKAKKEITSQVTAPKPDNQGGLAKSGGAAAKQAFAKEAEVVVVDQPVATVNEAKAIAQGVAQDISGDFLEAEGGCFGDPRVQAGTVVEIKGVGKKFSGKYLATSATHVLNRGSYETTFSITGKQPDTLLNLWNGAPRRESLGRVDSVVIGLVTNTKDPDDLGRVKVKFPWLGDNIESHWARVSAPMAGAQRGFYFLPEVDDEVLVAFEHGDVNYPYVVGGLWSSKDKPPLAKDKALASDGKVAQRIIKSRAGHVIILDDTDGEEKIVIRDKTEKNEIILSTKDNTLTINTEKDVKITAQGDINLKSTGDMILEGKNVNVKAQQNCEIKATQNFTAEATSNAEVKGLQVAVKGNTSVEVSAGAGKVAVGPATVNINSGALEVM